MFLCSVKPLRLLLYQLSLLVAAFFVVKTALAQPGQPANPLNSRASTTPRIHYEFPFQIMFLFQSLKYIPEWAAVLFYIVVLVFWALVPWLDRRASREQKSPVFTVIGIIMIAVMVGLTTLAYFSVAQEQAAAKTEINAADTTHH